MREYTQREFFGSADSNKRQMRAEEAVKSGELAAGSRVRITHPWMTEGRYTFGTELDVTSVVGSSAFLLGIYARNAAGDVFFVDAAEFEVVK